MNTLEQDPDKKVIEKIIKLIYGFTGIFMTDKKENLIRSRLRPRMRELKLGSFDEYVSFMEKDSKEVEVFVNLLTTNETTFFRTPRIWEYFNNDFLIKWKSQNLAESLNIWSAAASTGEEAYSISMSCLENGVNHFKIFGTDISTDVLDVAKNGIYTGRNFHDFQNKFPGLKEKYFDCNPESIQAKKILKDHVSFQSHNLFNQLKSNIVFDVVFLRNVLIYFKNEDQVKVLQNVSQKLKRGGILILGESESISRLETNFKYLSPLIYTND